MWSQFERQRNRAIFDPVCVSGEGGQAHLLAEQLRRKRKGKVSSRWYVDETYLKVNGKMVLLVSDD